MSETPRKDGGQDSLETPTQEFPADVGRKISVLERLAVDLHTLLGDELGGVTRELVRKVEMGEDVSNEDFAAIPTKLRGEVLQTLLDAGRDIADKE